ncbi:MAG TPA: carboxypeptidase-like regulatory domain-containing protein [Anaeromyxobacteraceae bacterium]|nr:carboxypeptidase-like regulatory domain-containing protein [Anaeromyxobacteraceae bacterium]
MQFHRLTTLAATALFAAGCSSGKSERKKTCLETGCEGSQVCESVPGGAPACFDPIYVEGRVYDLAIADPATNGLADARVVGQDVDGAPVSSVAISGADGAYEFSLRAARNGDGSPASGTVTLRVDRAGYEGFPSGLRTALPIALTSATHGSGRWSVKSGLTDVGLDAIAGAPTGSITGTVQLPSSGGALVVAECGGVAYTAVPGSDGTYAVFNVPAGTCDVTAYAKGVNYTPVTGATVGTSAVTADLSQSTVPTATVSGGVQFVSSTFWDFTSVLLVVDSTYDAVRIRGIAPPGLRVGGVTKGSNWTIAGIPDGHYHVLAAFETDYLVRDPSDIGGAAVLEFQVVNGVPLLMDGTTSAATLQGFKITGAVRLTAPIADATGACATISPLPADPGTLPVGGCTTISTTPSLAWEAYSATNVYEVTVVDELGATVWQAQVDKSASQVTYGATTSPVSKTLVAAQTLTTGTTYQVRVKAQTIDSKTGLVSGTLSASEDLLGVFTVVAP